MTSGFQKKTSVTVIRGEHPLPKPLQAVEIKIASLTNSAIHPRGV